MQVEDYKILQNGQSQYYIVIADELNYNKIYGLLKEINYEEQKDFVRIRPISYKKIWNEEL